MAARTFRISVHEEKRRIGDTARRWESGGKIPEVVRRFCSPPGRAHWPGRPLPEAANHSEGFRKSAGPPCGRKLTFYPRINKAKTNRWVSTESWSERWG